jgi:phosphatidylglycerol:prolipoprotein diacylglycerol transferase
MPSPADPTAFTLGPIEVRWYAVFILTGIVAAIWLIQRIARRRGMDPAFVLDVAPLVVLAGVVGARAYYVLLKPGYFAAHPDEIVNLRLGGLTIHGAITGGLLVLWWYSRRRDQRLLPWLDVIVPGLALAQAIGRWGNWANQEAFGTPSDLPWALEIEPSRRPDEYADAATFHPTFLYESLFNLANALILAWLAARLPRTRLREGDVFWLYLIAYGVARFVIERIRTDSLNIGPLPAAYWISFGLIGIGAAGLVLGHTVWPARHPDPLPDLDPIDAHRRAASPLARARERGPGGEGRS